MQNDFRRILILFAGFVIGMHVAVFLHELGHALGYWISSGTVTAIVMEAPLPAGHVAGVGGNAAAHVWGGVTFGTIICSAPLLIARCLPRRSALRFALLMIGAYCLAHNGIYLLVGSIVPFSDAQWMIALGSPRWLLFVLGLPVLVGFVWVLPGALRLAGLGPGDSFLKWLVISEVGLCSFLSFMITAMFFMPVPSNVRLPTVCFVSCYALCYAIAAFRGH